MKESKKERNLRFADGKWYLDFTFRGKRIRQFGGFTKEQARIALAKIRVDRLNKKLGIILPGDGDPIPFEGFAIEFLELYSKQNKRSWQRDESSLKNLRPFFRGFNLQDVGPENVERYKAKRRTEVSPGTVNREISCLKTMFNQAVSWGKLETNPLRAVKKLRENPPKERILSRDEARRLMECAAPGLLPFLTIALNTGMRRGEILSLRWADADLAKCYINITDGNSKSGKGRKVPMNRQVYETLRALPRVSEFVFYNPETKTHVLDMKTAFHSACRAVGINGLRVHDLRHTAASWMVESGIDLATVSKILGHSTIQMTMRYTHPTPENMRQAVNKLEEFFCPSVITADLKTDHFDENMRPGIN